MSAGASALEAGSLTLAWDPNPESDIAGYIIHYGTESGVYTHQVDVGNQTLFVLADLSDGQVYYFAVQAYNTEGTRGDLSAEVSGVAGSFGSPPPTDLEIPALPDLPPGPDPPTPSGISYLAEGATGPFFDFDVSLANPGVTPAPVALKFVKEDGTTVERLVDLAPMSQQVVHVDDIPGLEAGAVWTAVQSTADVIVERTMFWDANRYGGHGTGSSPGASTRWYFADGAQGSFETYFLLANPTAAPASVTLFFLREAGAIVFRTVTVQPTSRATIYAGDIPGLVGRSFSTVISSDVGIVAERAMYFGSAQLWAGGHESAGVTQLSRTWVHVEGATGPHFDTYILVGNPNGASADLTVTYILESGETIVKGYSVGPYQRMTIDVEAQDHRLANTAVSTTVESSVPIVSERTMYWPGAAPTWSEAHNSFGATQTATRWGLAEGRSGGPEGFETYILLANPGTHAAEVLVTFLRSSGPPITRTVTVSPMSRFNLQVTSVVPELTGETFGALIQSTNGVPLAVERAIYWNALGQTWAGGTNVVAVPLP